MNSSVVKAIVFGVISISLFVLLAMYADQTVEWARTTRAAKAVGTFTSDRMYFLVPIVIAFIFSYVHGNFTSYFWDALGFKAAEKKDKKK